VDWTGFGPLILPHAMTVSAPLMVQHARLAAIDFLKHTKAWRVDLTPLVGDGVLTSFPMVLPADSQVEKLLKVSVTDAFGNKGSASVLTIDYGADLAQSGTQELIAYTPDRVNLTVHPVQAVDASIVATVALKPTLTAATLPDAVFDQFGQLIAKGALATLLVMKDKPWTDTTAARIAYVEFINAKAVTARQVERGFAKSGRRSATRWF
jgi:hypothetical protein